jgi:hypothetical protein
MMQSDGATPRPGKGRFAVTFLVSVLLAFVLGYLAVQGLRWVQRTPAATDGQALPWRPPPVDLAPGALQRPALDVMLVHAGQRYRPGQTVALPTGSQFHLEMAATSEGTVRVQGINPVGAVSDIWAGPVQARQIASTPQLQLQGERGQERLRLVFTPAAQPGLVVMAQVVVLHQ